MCSSTFMLLRPNVLPRFIIIKNKDINSAFLVFVMIFHIELSKIKLIFNQVEEFNQSQSLLSMLLTSPIIITKKRIFRIHVNQMTFSTYLTFIYSPYISCSCQSSHSSCYFHAFLFLFLIDECQQQIYRLCFFFLSLNLFLSNQMYINIRKKYLLNNNIQKNRRFSLMN